MLLMSGTEVFFEVVRGGMVVMTAPSTKYTSRGLQYPRSSIPLTECETIGAIVIRVTNTKYYSLCTHDQCRTRMLQYR